MGRQYELLLSSILLLGLFGCGGGESSSEDAFASFDASETTVLVGETITFNAGNSSYEEIRWKVSGENYSECKDFDLCDIQMNEVGSHVVEIQVKSTTKNKTVMVEVGESTSRDSASIQIEVLPLISETASNHDHTAASPTTEDDKSDAGVDGDTSNASNPVMSGLKQWLDGQDTRTLDVDSGCTQNTQGLSENDLIGCWIDKSGNGNNAVQQSTHVRPSYRQNLSGAHAGVSFDGVGSYLGASGSVLPHSSLDHSIFMVIRPHDVAGTGGLWGQFAAGMGENHVLKMSSGFIKHKESSSTDSTLSSNSTVTAGDVIVIAFHQNTDVRRLMVNGELSSSTSPANLTGDTPTDWSIGAIAGASGFYNGDIGEILIYDRSLSAAEFTDNMNYLSHKWGVQF